MKFVYGIHGYGRGHATRSLSILQQLEGHDILVMAGGDAYDLLEPLGYDMFRIPTLAYVYGKRKDRFSMWLSFKHMAPMLWDIFTRGKDYGRIKKRISDFKPDAVINDSEPWTGRSANNLGIPLISVDHYAVLSYGDWDMPGKLKKQLGTTTRIYRFYLGKPDRIIGSAFYPAKPTDSRATLVGPIIRKEVREADITEGDHLLVYFNNQHFFTPEIEKRLTELDVEVHAFVQKIPEDHHNIRFFRSDNCTFVREISSCRSIITSAGNQLAGEALFLRKPMLIVPEASTEQQMNSWAVQNMGVGLETDLDQLASDGFVKEFLERENEFRSRITPFSRDYSPDVAREILRFARRGK